MNAVQSWQNMLLSSLWHAHLHAKCTFLHFKGLIMRDIFLTFTGGVVVHSTELWCQQHRFSSHLVIVWMCVRMAACLYICPVTDWKPFWGFVCLLPKVIWKRLQFPITLSISEAQHFKCSGPLCEFLESLRCHGIKKKKDNCWSLMAHCGEIGSRYWINANTGTSEIGLLKIQYMYYKLTQL